MKPRPRQIALDELVAHSRAWPPTFRNPPETYPPRRRRRIHVIKRSTLHDTQPSEVRCTCGVTVTGADAASVADAYRAHRADMTERSEEAT
jgi:hypothetical protein